MGVVRTAIVRAQTMNVMNVCEQQHNNAAMANSQSTLSPLMEIYSFHDPRKKASGRLPSDDPPPPP